jgi:hypothetical protein
MNQPTPTLRPRREHPRISAGLLVTLQLGARQVAARARDLSMAGLFLDGPLSQLPGEIGLSIALPGQAREVHTTCRLERREAAGVALSFARIEWEDLLLVARYLSPRL